MDWFFYAVLALGSFVVYDLLSRKLAVKSINPKIFAAIFYTIVAACTPLLLLVEPLQIVVISLPIIVLLIICLAVWALFGRFEYTAHKYVEASTLSVIIRLAPALTFIYSAAFLGEAVTIIKIIAITLILAANVLMTTSEIHKGTKYTRGILYAFLITVLLSIGWTMDKILIPYLGVVAYSFLTFASPAITNFLIPPLKKADIYKELKNTHLPNTFILALINLIGYAAMLKALKMGEVSRVAPIATSTTPFVVILGILILGERTNVVVKIIASILTVTGIILLR